MKRDKGGNAWLGPSVFSLLEAGVGTGDSRFRTSFPQESPLLAHPSTPSFHLLLRSTSIQAMITIRLLKERGIIMKKMLITLVTIFSVASAIFVATPATKAQAATTPLLQQGDQYGHVWGAQNRLKQLGLYKGEIDGLFGPLTKDAVMQFQRQQGLTIDGIMGANTWQALRNQTFTQNEIQMLAQVIHGEARGESFEGKVAVAAVVLNRLHDQEFPNTIKGIIFETRAFTAVQDKQYYLTPNNSAYKAAYAATKGWDPTQGSTYYFNPKTATSDWIWSRQQVKQIGKHIFAK